MNFEISHESRKSAYNYTSFLTDNEGFYALKYIQLLLCITIRKIRSPKFSHNTFISSNFLSVLRTFLSLYVHSASFNNSHSLRHTAVEIRVFLTFAWGSLNFFRNHFHIYSISQTLSTNSNPSLNYTNYHFTYRGATAGTYTEQSMSGSLKFQSFRKTI